jgi:hypothetical protein
VSATDTAAALLALLAADPNLKVYDGKVPVDNTGKPPTRPYVVLYAPDDTSSVDDLTGRSRRGDGVYQVTTVADEADSLRLVRKRVKTVLLDVRPDVTGRTSFPIRHDYSNPALRDDDVQPPVMYGTDGWRCASVASS